MKKTVAALSALVMAVACSPNSGGYVVEGTIAGLESGKIILSNDSDAFPVSDTTEVKNGKFTFSGTVVTPEIYSLSVENEDAGSLKFFLVNGKISINGDIADLRHAAVTGPQVTMDAKTLMEKQDSLLTQARIPFEPEWYDEMENPATPAARKAEIQALYEKSMAQIQAAYEACGELFAAYAKENPYSPLSVVLIASSVSDYAPEVLSALADSLRGRPELEGNRFLDRIATYAANAKSIGIGQPAPDFTQATPDGTPLTFSTVYQKNKLTMIDFWASWCGPCRRFNPSLVKLYNKYHAKGFEIVAVSCDKDRDEWLKAIAADKLAWFHVSDLKGWNNAVAKQFNILSIPQNVFVNADGVFVAKQVEEEKLEAFLKEQLK